MRRGRGSTTDSGSKADFGWADPPAFCLLIQETSMTSSFPAAIQGPTAWSGPEIQDSTDWQIRITPEEDEALRAGLAALRARNLSMLDIEVRDFPLPPPLASLRDRLVRALRDERGFVVVRGFPVSGLSDDDIRLMYLGFSKHLGTCVSQDPACAFIADVKERGLGTGPLTRAYGNKHGTRLHVDLADTVGLLGVRQAPRGATSLLASSSMIYNEFVAQHPEWIQPAMEGFYWDRYGEHKPWEEAVS